MSLSLSVVIPTYNRSECIRRCLESLQVQEPKPSQVIVIDASTDSATYEVVRAFPGVTYSRNETGYGHMTQSRNLGLILTTGVIVAFLDDDAFAHPGWTQALLEPYADETVGGVGGRALNRQPGEESFGVDTIGRLLPNGELTGFFAADPGGVIDVDHLVGCNMSFRRSALLQLRGLRDDYPGTEIREDSDICLRVRRLGYRLLFTPFAVVDHIGAPQGKGQRFDLRYAYYAQRNHMVLLLRNFGPFSGIFWRYMGRTIGHYGFGELTRRVGAALARQAVLCAGTVVGIGAGLRHWAVDRGVVRSSHPSSPLAAVPAGAEEDKG